MKQIGIYKRLLSYLKPYWKQAVFAYSSMLLGTIMMLLVPEIIKRTIDTGLASGTMRALFGAAGLILLAAVVRSIAGLGQIYFSEWLSLRVAYDLRNEFYATLQHLPFAFYDDAHTGDLMSRGISDIQETQRFVGFGMAELASSILLIIGVIVAMLLQDVTITLYTLLPLPILLAAVLRFGNNVRGQFRTMQAQLGDVSQTMQESLTGIRVVKAFAREPHELEKFGRENDEWFDERYKLIKIWSSNWPFFTFLITLSIVILLYVGGPAALAGDITVGKLFALVSYVLLMSVPVQRLGFLVNSAASAGGTAIRIFEIMDTPNPISEKSAAVTVATVDGRVAFSDVSFAYRDEQPILSNISFTTEPDKVVALIGPTGSGKSTIINLLPRFYDPNSGNITIDGIDIRDMTLESLRHHIGIVLQDPFLFSDTIGDNIAYGRPNADSATIEQAARAARAHDFIVGFPDGYDTRVGERGVTLSGGQKQRIAIARALLNDPRILILDDATSSVDTETEHLIQQALATLMQGRTTFVIAQRLQTLKKADQILVLDKGAIVARGTHDELLAAGGLYREIYDMQLKDQEEFMALEAR